MTSYSVVQWSTRRLNSRSRSSNVIPPEARWREGHRGRDLDLGDLGDSDRMAGGGIGKRGYPRAPDLGQVAFDQRARVEIVGSHSFGPRISRMTSLSGLPPARSNIFRASSSERVDCAAISFISCLGLPSRLARRRVARGVP